MKISIIEDQIEVLKSLEKLIKRKNLGEVLSFSGEEGIDYTVEKVLNTDLLILDVNLGFLSGIDILKAVREKNKSFPVILITAYTTAENIIEATKYGVRDILEKPFDQQELLNLINKIKKDIKKDTEPNFSFDGEKFIGSFETLGDLFKKIGIASSNDMNVFISGETGVGKELVAKLIANHSGKKFIAVNCAAIPKDLFESELFGHEKGAFTGATERKIGLIELANEGVLFLDEIGELPLELQSKLLRFLETKTFYRVGGTQPLKSNVKVVSASNIDVEEYIKERKFREDLYYRLSQIIIKVPPLRERKEDIPKLIKYFISKANEELKTDIKGITEEAEKALINYNFPGNVRELKNIIYSACLNKYAGNIDIEDIKFTQENQCNMTEEEFIEKLIGEYGIENVSKLKEKLEELVIIKTFEKTGENISKTAKLLNISRNTLKSKLRKLNFNLKES